MRITRFEDIEAWREARLLVKDVYGLFCACRDFAFRDQIQRASISIMSNIAEGFERKGRKEFLQFLAIARGSVAEVKSLTYAAADIGFLVEEQVDLVHARCNRLNGLLNGFIRYLKNSTSVGKN